MSARWSPQQREWLQALGHEVLVLAGTPVPAELAPLAADTCRADPARGSRASTQLPSSPARESESESGSVILRAVLRAAGRRDIGDLAMWLPDPDVLRGDAAAKRALWPRLRALRRSSRNA